MSKKTKIKISKAHKGKRLTEAHRLKISVGNTGKKMSKESKYKIRATLMGHKVTKKARAKMSKIRKKNPNRYWLGKKMSEEHKRKNSAGHKGQTAWNKGKKSDTIPWNKGLRGTFKHSKEARMKIGAACTGTKHYNWQGGKSLEPYTVDWTRTLRRSIRERDEYTCQLCGRHQEDKAFCVHHIDYDKKNCSPSNLITLCVHCHNKTNTNRNYWTEYFN